MSALRAGSKPVLSSCALAALTTLAGCSSTGSSQYTAQSVAPPRALAQAATAVEDDGLPAQSPPPGRIRLMPDNPGEPFSKNYGGGNPAALRAGAGGEQHKRPAENPAVPQDLPPAFRQKLVTALSQDE